MTTNRLSRIAQEEVDVVLARLDPRYQALLARSGLRFFAEDSRNRGALGSQYGYPPFDANKNILAIYGLRSHVILLRRVEPRTIAHECMHALDACYEQTATRRFYSDTLPKDHALRVLYRARNKDGRIVHNGYGGASFGEFFAESLLPFACTGIPAVATPAELQRIDRDTFTLFREFHDEFCRRIEEGEIV